MKSPKLTKELDLHGNTVDEAIPRVEGFLYQARKSGLKQVWIIHGKGTGVLKTEVWQQLTHHPLVRSYYLADKFHGGEGTTQVNLNL